ncbi:MAG: VRR-NUC domain-containing protein [Fimbriimonadales bacterium]|nr:VRR-NUC domain-containing protein [Fimbriimonadales bacterium]
MRPPTVRLLLDAASSERDLQRALIELARLTGWRVYHARPAQYRSGKWTTPLTGDAGLPDLILCKPPRLIFAELKSARGRVSPAQAQWMDALRACGVEVYLWKPSDWQAIVATLTEP